MFDISSNYTSYKNNYGIETRTYAVFYKNNKIGKITASPPVTGYAFGRSQYADYFTYEYTIYRNSEDSYNEIRSHNKNYKTLFEAKKRMEERFRNEGLSSENYKKPYQKVDIKFLTADENAEFYPTPSKLAGEMLAGIPFKDFCGIKTVLEPSAGKGDLVEAFKIRAKKGRGAERLKFDCIEKDANLRYLLEGKGERVIFDDFLRFHTSKKYDLIFMNPPFSDGGKHLLKAIDLQKNGGKVCCLLNAETLRNPFTNERKVLLQQLRRYNAKTKYINNAFATAERKAQVDVVIVWLDIPYYCGESSLLEGLERAKQEESYIPEVTDLCFGGTIEGMIQRFELECKLVTELMREYEAIKPYIMRSYKDTSYNSPIIELRVNDSSYNGLNDAIHSLRYKYWSEFMTNEDLTSRFTSNLREKYSNMISDMSEYDFNTFNVQKVLLRMNAEIVGGVEEEVYKIFDKLSEQHSWYPECKNNIHYYNGWKTNSAHKVGMKAIVPTYGVFSTYSWDRDSFSVNEAYKALADIEKVFNYLDGCVTQEVNLTRMLQLASANGTTKNIRCKYFTVTFYKKGTVHIKMHPETQRIIDSMNIFVAKGRKWLPPHYGTTKYSDMDEESKRVIDEFQGEKAYEQVMEHPSLYLFEPSPQILSITAKEEEVC